MTDSYGCVDCYTFFYTRLALVNVRQDKIWRSIDLEWFANLRERENGTRNTCVHLRDSEVTRRTRWVEFPRTPRVFSTSSPGHFSQARERRPGDEVGVFSVWLKLPSFSFSSLSLDITRSLYKQGISFTLNFRSWHIRYFDGLRFRES